jgi:hypothetical protein
MDYDGMDDAMTNQANKQTGVLRRFGLAGAAIVAACLAAGATFLGYGVDANLPWPVTANTTIAAKYCGGTVQAGTGSTGFFTVTVPAVSGFPSNCVVNITNGDTTALRGKGIAGLSGSGCSTQNILWPGQTCKIGIVNGAWAVLSRPGRWRPPQTFGTLTNFYSDYTNGTDTTGATDGLAPGSSAFKTASHCLTFVGDQIDFNALGQTQAACNMAAATNDLAGMHIPFHDLSGAQGGAALQLIGASLSISGAISNGGLCEIAVPSTATYSVNEIVSVYGVNGATGCNGTWKITVTDGTHLTLQSTTFGGSYTSGGTVTNGSAIIATNEQALQCFFGTTIEFANVFFQSNQDVFNPTSGCYAILGGGNIFGGSPPAGSLIAVRYRAQLHITADIGVASGAANAAIQANLGALFTSDAAANVNFLPGINPSFSGLGFVYAADLAEANFGGLSINLNGNTVTGQRCQANSGGYIASGSGNANTYFPGNSNCTQSGGGNIDGVISANDIGAGVLGAARLPGSGATTVAGQSCALGSTCGLTSASNAISANVNLNNTSLYIDGPSMAQGTAGTWFAQGVVTLSTNAASGIDLMRCKLWDGTTIISSAQVPIVSGFGPTTIALSGILTSPAANIKISCRDTSSTSGLMQANVDGSSNTATEVSGIRIN